MYFSDLAIDTRTWGEAEEDHRLDRQDGLTPGVGAPNRTQCNQQVSRTILSFTGHRPQRMGGFNPDNPIALVVRAQLAEAIGRATRAGFRTFIAGGALGFDYWAAYAVLDHQQQLIPALPFAGHDHRWNDQRRRELAALIRRTQAAGIDGEWLIRLPSAALGCKNGCALFSAECKSLYLLHAANDLLDLGACRHLPGPEEAQHCWQINRVDPIGVAISHGTTVITQEWQATLLAQRDGLAFTRVEFPRQRCGQRVLLLG